MTDRSAPPPDRSVTVQFMVWINETGDARGDALADLTGELEHAVQACRLDYTDIQIIEGQHMSAQDVAAERERILDRELIASALTRIELHPLNGKILADQMADALVGVIRNELAAASHREGGMSQGAAVVPVVREDATRTERERIRSGAVMYRDAEEMEVDCYAIPVDLLDGDG